MATVPAGSPPRFSLLELDNAKSAIDQSLPRPRKRKTEQSKATDPHPSKKFRKSKLQGFLEMPLDIVDIITGYLDPKTLISLSRVSHNFRVHLSPEAIWKRCRKVAGLPVLEAGDITDKQYIHLLFDTHCHDCGRANIQKLDLLACSRLCVECRTASQVMVGDGLPEYHPQAWLCAKDYTPDCWILKGRKWRNKPRGIFKISQLLDALHPEEIGQFVQFRVKLKEQISRDAEKITEWLQGESLNRKEDNVQVASARVKAITERLVEMGWTYEVLCDISAWSCTGVYIPKVLTNRGWNVLKGPLLATLRQNLQDMRVAARQGSMVQAYDSFFERDQQKPLFPSFNTFSSFDPVHEVVNIQPIASTPELEPFKAYDEEAWQKAYPKIMSYIRDYQSLITKHAKMLLTRAYIAANLQPPSDSTILTDKRSLFRVSTERVRPGYTFNQIRPFPLIHEVMRDRQDIGLWGEECRRTGIASEFLAGEEMLMVDLEVWKEFWGDNSTQ
ncbi:hypothetical protein DL96DRAFT_1580953 [Flagelloscypha sp. PMI_526]|nr:hypothetical protein DL96DRAFT_1580953 [Flagelloscypha sp. PMI_526]